MDERTQDALAWLKEFSRNEDAQGSIGAALSSRGFGSAREWAAAEPEKFIGFVDGLIDMEDQLPGDA